MAELLSPGTKVKYTHLGKEEKGIIHGVKTHEEPDGQITKVSYLIDTGRENPEHIGREDYQPEQIEVDQNYVKPV